MRLVRSAIRCHRYVGIVLSLVFMSTEFHCRMPRIQSSIFHLLQAQSCRRARAVSAWAHGPAPFRIGSAKARHY